MIAKEDFLKKFGTRLVPVASDNAETGDFMLFHPEERYIASEYLKEGYSVASVFETETGDVVSLDDDTSEHPYKIGYLIISNK